MLANQVTTNEGLLLSDKWVSERHAVASQTKMTAGEAAKKLRTRGLKLSAKELVDVHKTLTGRDPEWHHSGFYKGKNGSAMGRTFFFTEKNITFIFENYSKVADIKAKKQAEIEAKRENIVKGFYYVWDYDYGGRNGKKRNFKVLKTYEGSELEIPASFTTLSNEEFENAKSTTGRKYFGWDEPTRGEFNPVAIEEVKIDEVRKQEREK